VRELTSRQRWTAIAAAAVLVAASVGAAAVVAGRGDARPGAAGPAEVTATSTPTRSPSPSPAPTSEPPVPDVPVQDASLAPVTAAPEPAHLTLPTLGVDLPVDPVGVADDGQMEIPPHAERAGWYRYGPVPGDAAGTAVIAAHVDSIASAGLGPFARLKDLAVGDPVDVALADGGVVHFTVADVAQVPKTDVTWPDVFDRDGAPRTVLVTCGGKWQPKVRHYADNVIVSLAEVGRDGPP